MTDGMSVEPLLTRAARTVKGISVKSRASSGDHSPDHNFRITRYPHSFSNPSGPLFVGLFGRPSVPFAANLEVIPVKIENLSFETVPRVSSIAARTEALVCSFSKEVEQEDVSLCGFAFANGEVCEEQ
jgi:hypothetical protein